VVFCIYRRHVQTGFDSNDRFAITDSFVCFLGRHGLSSFLHFFISSFLHFFISSFLHFFISSFLHFFISSFPHFFILRLVDLCCIAVLFYLQCKPIRLLGEMNTEVQSKLHLYPRKIRG